MTWVNTGGAVSGGGVTSSPFASEAEVQALKTDGLAGAAIQVTATGTATTKSAGDVSSASVTATGSTTARTMADVSNDVSSGAGVVWMDPRGDAETVGTNDFPTKVVGWYQLLSAGGVFNQIDARIWCTDATANLEWRAWVRPTDAVFNMAGTTPVDQGVIPAAMVPHSNSGTMRLSLNSTVTVPAGFYFFILFRASNASSVTVRSWSYNPSAFPVRTGFPFWTASLWDHQIAFSGPSSGQGYGQTAIRLLLAPAISGAKWSPPRQPPDLTLPPTIYVTQGREGSVYLDNIITGSAVDYAWDVANGPAAGTQQNERWTIVPAAAITPTAITISALDRWTGAALASATSNVVGAASTAGTGTTLKAIFVGDSLTNAGTYTQELLNIATADALKIGLYGTRGTPPNSHEGRPGWTISNYTSNFSDGTGANPFWIGGVVNFPQYLTNNAIPVPDWVFVMLGTNDVFSQTTDAGVYAASSWAFTSLDTLVTSIKAAGAGVKVGLIIPPPPSNDQDAFGANYASGQTRWRYKRNIVLWAKALTERYAGQEASRIYIVPANLNLDTVNNMLRAAAAPVNSRSSITVQRQANGVHPDTPGYNQLADGIWAFLKVQTP